MTAGWRLRTGCTIASSAGCSGGAGEIKSSFVRGVAGGFLAERWGVSDPDEVVVREEKCVAKGDPFCEARVWVERKKRSSPSAVSSRTVTHREDTPEEGVATG
jgi:hypothetical protein